MKRTGRTSRTEASGGKRGSTSASSRQADGGHGALGKGGRVAPQDRAGLVQRQKVPAGGAGGRASGGGGGPGHEGRARNGAGGRSGTGGGVGSGGDGGNGKSSSGDKSGGVAPGNAHAAGLAGGGSVSGSGPAAGSGGTAAGGGGDAAGDFTTYSVGCEVPAAARPWLSAHHRTAGQSSVTVYGRAPDGTVSPYTVILTSDWRLTGTGHLAADLGIRRGDVLRFRREMVAAAGSGAAGADMGVVVEKAAGLPKQEEQEQQEQEQQDGVERAPRTEVHVGPLVDLAGPAAGRIVVSDEHKFHDGGTTIVLRRHVVPHLLGAAHIEQAMAEAASDGGCTQQYVVTVYARWPGEAGLPLAFSDVHLTPCGRGTSCPTWLLTCLRPLHGYLELPPRAPVRLVREVGQDGRVRLVVEHRQGGRRGKRKEVTAQGMGPAAQGAEGGEARGGGGNASSGEEDVFGTKADGDGEQNMEPSDGGGRRRAGTGTPDGVAREAEGKGIQGTGLGNPEQRRGPGGGGGAGLPGALAAEGAREDAGSAGVVRPCKRQRLGAPAGLDDGAAEGAAEGEDVQAAQRHGPMDARDPAPQQGAIGAQDERMLDMLEAHVEGTKGALQHAQAKAATLAADKAALEGQLAAERDRAEAAEGRFRRAQEHLAGVLRGLGLPVEGATGHGQQLPSPHTGQELQQHMGAGGDGAGPSGAVGPVAGGLGLGPEAGKEGRADGRRLGLGTEMTAERPAAAQHGATEGEDVHPAPQQQETGAEEERMRCHTDMLAAHVESTQGALAAAQARAAALEGQLAAERAKAAQQLERERERADAAEGQLHRTQERLSGLLRRVGLPAEGPAGQPPLLQQQPPAQPRTPVQPSL